MKRRDFLILATGSPVLLASQAPDGFEELFDGQSLKGWSVVDGPRSAFFVSDGAIVGSQSSKYPAWLRCNQSFQNFDFRCDFFIRGWIDGGVYLHAPLHGRPGWVGKQVKIFHLQEEQPKPNSMGAIFPLVAPSSINVKSDGAWNSLRIHMDWPRLGVWVNDLQVQDLDLTSHPELAHRVRAGYLGLSALGYPIRYRNLRIRRLPDQESLQPLYVTDSDFEKWFVSESTRRAPARFQSLGGIIRAEGGGHLATREKFRDFELTLYVRGPREHNGGVLVRSAGEGLGGPRYYEIQIHNVADAHYPTGSLYHHKRAAYPRLVDEEWFPMQIRFQGRHCLVRVNGDTVLEYDRLENLEEGHIELQAHRPGSWLEFKEVMIKRL